MARTGIEPPAGWRATASPDGGIDLRVASSSAQKRLFVAIVWTAAIVWSGLAVFHVPNRLAFSVPMPLAIINAVLLYAFAVWCALGDETWHLDQNVVQHRVGIGGWCRRWTYVDAELQIVCGYTGLHPASVPYYRLYAVREGARHFLFERSQSELERLQAFIGQHTGWPVRT